MTKHLVIHAKKIYNSLKTMTMLFMTLFILSLKHLLKNVHIKGRSSRSQMFFKIGLFKNFVKFTGTHLYWSLFF